MWTRFRIFTIKMKQATKADISDVLSVKGTVVEEKYFFLEFGNPDVGEVNLWVQ